MKRLLMIGSLILIFTGCSTIGDIEPDRSDFTYEYEFPGVEQDELYQESLRYVSRAFESAQDVIQYENAEEGELIGNGTISYDGGWGTGTWVHDLRFSINILTRDERVQIRFDNLEGYGTDGWGEKEYRTFNEEQYRNAQDRLESIAEDYYDSVMQELEDDF